MTYGNPNHYTHDDVIRLARLMEPRLWEKFDAQCALWLIAPTLFDKKPSYYNDAYGLYETITYAGKILMAGYRNCTI
jgi:hypothetical protein